MSDAQATHYEGKIIIGLTGNIATGKSAVMRLAADQGALTIDADKVVHELMETNDALQQAIGKMFGENVRWSDGRINREALGQIVFTDPQALRQLESLTHPLVRYEVDQRIIKSKAQIVFIEAIKLLDGDIMDSCHQIWVTRCDRQKQLERLRVCRGLEMSEATQRIKMQGAQEEKVALADMVIDTNGFMKETKEQFMMAWNRLPVPRTVTAKPRLVKPGEKAPIPHVSVSKPESAPATAVAATEPAPITTSTPATAAATAAPEATPLELGERPADLQVRRARPNDIPSILLLIQQATNGAVKMKRNELLMALSDRGYFIGQIGSDISTIFGWNIDSQVGRVDEIYIHPPDMVGITGAAVLEEINQSANQHVCQIVVAFLSNDAPPQLHQLFAAKGYTPLPWDELAANWQAAIQESQPENTTYVLKILRDIRKK